MTETSMNLQDFFERYIVYPWENFRPIDILDLLLLTTLFYTVYILLFRGRQTARMGIGVLLLVTLSFLAEQLGLPGFHSVMSVITPYTVVLLAVIYQPELRIVLARIGSIIPRIRSKRRDGYEEMENTIHMVVDAACQIAQTEKNGALIVLELFQKIDHNVDVGFSLDMPVHRDILCSMFEDKTLFHDGAVVIRDHRIVMAGAKLPLRKNGEMVDGLGTRHRAAVGITEVSDCVVVVVSEETHMISIANNGNIERDFNQNGDELGNPETRARIEKSLRRALYNMLIGLELNDPKLRRSNGIDLRVKWGFGLDAEDRERITKEREKESSALEKFEKSYQKKKQALLAQEKERAAAEGADVPAEENVTPPAAPSEENAGMPSITMAPVELRDKPETSDADASDET